MHASEDITHPHKYVAEWANIHFKWEDGAGLKPVLPFEEQQAYLKIETKSITQKIVNWTPVVNINIYVLDPSERIKI